MKKRALIGIICLVLSLILAGGLITTTIVQSTQMTTAYVASTELPQGTLIEDKSIKEVKVHKSDQSDLGYVTDKANIVGKYAAVDMLSGTAITKDSISVNATATDNQFLSIPSGKQAISISVKSGPESLSNKLEVGDIVRIYTYGKNGEIVSPDELKYVQIAGFTSEEYEDVEGGNAEGGLYTTVTFIAYTSQVEQFIRAQKNGAYFTLISRGNTETAEKLLAEQEKLLGGGVSE